MMQFPEQLPPHARPNQRVVDLAEKRSADLPDWLRLLHRRK